MLQWHGVLFHVLAECVRRLYVAELLGVFQTDRVAVGIPVA